MLNNKLFLVICCLLLIRTGVMAQQENKTVSLDLEQVSVGEFFDNLRKKSGLDFVYNAQQMKEMPKISIHVKKEPVSMVLDKVFDKTNYSWTIKNNIVTIVYAPTHKGERVITGTVTDDKKEPIPGVSVSYKYEDKVAGTTTDIDGHYTINIPTDCILTFSFVGMKPFKANTKGKNVINALLRDDSQMMEEVVVTGIFNRKKGSFTGASVTMKSDEIIKSGTQNIFQSLKNLDPTLAIGDNFNLGSDPNSMPDMSIRGTSSLGDLDGRDIRSQYANKPNQPLFILDGFEASLATIVDLDMERIASVTILKDASSKAIYGSKAANGVIVIETKKLMGKDTHITYNGSLYLEVPDLSSYNLTNSIEKLDIELADGRYSMSNVGSSIDKEKLYNERRRRALEGLNTDWMAKPLQTGVGQKHNINIELGDSRKLYAIMNFTANDIVGAMKGSYRRNISTSANVSYRTDHFIFRNIMSYLVNKSEDSPYGSFYQYTRMNPYWEAEDDKGNILRWAEENIPNPMYDATIGTKLGKNYTEFIDNFYAEFIASKDIRATLRLGYTQNKSGADEFYPASHSRFALNQGDKENNGLYRLNNGHRMRASADLNVRFTRHFGKHYLFVNLGSFTSQTEWDSYWHEAEGFSNSTMADITFARHYKEGRPSGSSSINREASFLLSATYDYDNRYLLDATVRESASSLYGSNNRWANSWSAGLGWNIHNERFMSDIKQLKLMKLRASLGLTGNQNFNTNNAVATYNYITGIIYAGQMGAYLAQMPNPDLKWEQKMDYNVGMDLNYHKINLSVDLYRSDTKNMLTNLSIPTSTGFSVVKDNLGKVRNKGYEIKASYNVFKNKNSYLNIFGSIAGNKNYIVSLSESLKSYNERIEKESMTNTQEAVSKPIILYKDGRSMSTIWAVPSAGIDPGLGKEVFIKQDGTYTYEYDPTDLRPMGDSNPSYRGNIGFSGEVNGLGMTLTCNFIGGGQYYNSTLVQRVENANIEYNVDKRLAEGRWRKPGDVTRFKKLKNDSGATRPTSRFIQNRNEISISNLSVYYRFPKKYYQKLNLDQLRVAFNVSDLKTFSSIEIERGTAYPFSRKFTMSVTATF